MENEEGYGQKMKIIHTSDWHLGHRLYNYDGTEEELHFFTQLAAAVEEERPDALLVSGDIFDIGAPGNDVAKRFTDALLDVTARCPDMTTVLIAGNHDSYSRLVVHGGSGGAAWTLGGIAGQHEKASRCAA